MHIGSTDLPQSLRHATCCCATRARCCRRGDALDSACFSTQATASSYMTLTDLAQLKRWGETAQMEPLSPSPRHPVSSIWMAGLTRISPFNPSRSGCNCFFRRWCSSTISPLHAGYARTCGCEEEAHASPRGIVPFTLVSRTPMRPWPMTCPCTSTEASSHFRQLAH
jgi:hypothetical protein